MSETMRTQGAGKGAAASPAIRRWNSDLVDAMPFIGVADDLVARCRDAAKSAGVRWYHEDTLHDWAVERYADYDHLVKRAMNALFARDCVWGVADLDHPLLERYAWELAAEISDSRRNLGRDRYRRRDWLMPVGNYESCGMLHEVLLEWPALRIRETPHLLVRAVHFPPIPGVCVGLFEPIYVPSGYRRWQFDDRHRDDFAAFMEGPAEDGDGWTNWDMAAEDWLCALTVEEEGEGTWEHREGEVPDYRLLHWPEAPDGKGDDGSC